MSPDQKSRPPGLIVALVLTLIVPCSHAYEGVPPTDIGELLISTTVLQGGEENLIEVRRMQAPESAHEIAGGAYEEYRRIAEEQSGKTFQTLGNPWGNDIFVVTATSMPQQDDPPRVRYLGFLYAESSLIERWKANIVMDPTEEVVYLVLARKGQYNLLMGIARLDLGLPDLSPQPDPREWRLPHWPAQLPIISEVNLRTFAIGFDVEKRFASRLEKGDIIVDVGRARDTPFRFRMDIETREWSETDGQTEVSIKDNTSEDGRCWHPIHQGRD